MSNLTLKQYLILDCVLRDNERKQNEVTERELQHYLVDQLRANNFWVASTSRRNKNVSRGIPDILAYDLLEARRWFIEVKGPHTPLSPEQEEAQKLGAIVVVRNRIVADLIWQRKYN